ncbi:MAG: LeuD/DmdB family oxidoreductase small subunit [Promethearchaeota archaeon]|jgi:3-isopropylmalate/(R)-2-methylmalate dehydratase small subunit
MIKPTKLSGKAIVIKDSNGNGLDDIDTDMIFHNKHLHITDISEMGQYAFGNLEGWRRLPSMATKGSILIVGKNFGAGSSRQQAVDCFKALGVILIIGESFGAIYKRNAINSGMPLLTAPEIMSTAVDTGDLLRIDLTSGEFSSETKNMQFSNITPLSQVQLDIYFAGNLFEYGKSLE